MQPYAKGRLFKRCIRSIDWLHIPSLSCCISGIISKYFNFFNLVRNYPSLIAIPTLDVDLVWHTHQVSANAYYNYSIRQACIFIDQDDKVKESTLSDCFTRTNQLLESSFKSIRNACVGIVFRYANIAVVGYFLASDLLRTLSMTVL